MLRITNTRIGRTIAALLSAGVVAAAVPTAASADNGGGLSGVGSWQDGSIGYTIGCSIAQEYINPDLCGAGIDDDD